jgi:Ca2+-binding RTX toxin-like protein
MATITYTDALAVNPALDDPVIFGQNPGSTLDATQATPTLLELTNSLSGYVIQITGTDFLYVNVIPFGLVPIGGIITEITIRNDLDNVVANITGPFGTDLLAVFTSALIVQGDTPLALNNLFSGSDTVIGSTNDDHLTAFGLGVPLSEPDTLLGGAGNDILTTFTGASDIMAGGAGDDVFNLATPNGLPNLFGLEVHGGQQNGDGGEDETDYLLISGNNPSFASITDIDGVRFEDNSVSQNVFFGTSQIGVGLVSTTLAVEGDLIVGSEELDQITILRDSLEQINLDLSGWTFTNWSEGQGLIIVDLDDATPTDDTLVGSSVRDIIYSGAANDSLRGGAGGDDLHGGAGNDQLFSELDEGPGIGEQELLEGGAGVDFALVDRSDSSRSFNLDLGDPALTSAIGDGTTIVNVEQIEFHAGSGNDHLTGGALNDKLVGNAGTDFLDGNGGDDDLQGGDGADTLSGDAGEDTLAGGAGIDILDGGADNDRIIGGLGIDFIDGGEGVDTAVFAGSQAAYTITPIGNDFQITGPDGTDLLTNVEFAEFDGGVTVALTAVPNQAPTVTSNGGGDNATIDIAENTTAVTRSLRPIRIRGPA